MMTISPEYTQILDLEIIKVKEKERRNIARELHDEMAQYLTGIHFYANSIMRSNAGTSIDDAKAIDMIASKIFDVIHNKITQLRIQEHTKLNFVDNCSRLIRDWELKNKAISVDFYMNGIFTGVDSYILFTVYRLIQECLTNISRHAQASSVIIKIKRWDNWISATIIDNGKGFIIGKDVGRYGVLGMRERVAECDGELTIKTSINKGVVVDALLPCRIINTGDI